MGTYEEVGHQIQCNYNVMYFTSFIVYDKLNDSLKLQLPPQYSSAKFCGVIEVSPRALESLYGKPVKLNPDSEIGVLISQLFEDTYLLYLQPCGQLDEKYKSFMQKMIVNLCGSVCFGERINYNRVAKKLDTYSLPEQSTYFVSEKQDCQAEVYQIKSLEDNRLEIGTKISKQTLKSVSYADYPANKQLVVDYLEQLQDVIKQKSQYSNVTNLNDIFIGISRSITVKRQLKEFKQNLYGNTSKAITVEQLSRLCQLAKFICQKNITNRRQREEIVGEFRREVEVFNQPLRQKIVKQITEDLVKRDFSSYGQLKQFMGENEHEVDSQLGLYYNRCQSKLLSKSIMLEVFTKNSDLLFDKLTKQLEEECTTKKCLTDQMYQQISVCDNLKLMLESAEKRLEQLKNYDQVLNQKEMRLTSYFVKNQQLQLVVGELKGQKFRLEGECASLMESVVQNSMENGRLTQQLKQATLKIQQKEQTNKNLNKFANGLQEEVKRLEKELKNSLNQMRLLSTANTQLRNMVTHYKRVVSDIENNFKSIRNMDANKINYALKANIKQYQKLMEKLYAEQHNNREILKDIAESRKENQSLRTQILYYQKLYKIKDKTSVNSALDGRLNQSVGDMVIFQRNQQNQTTDRLDRQANLNQTFEYRSSVPEDLNLRRSDGCLGPAPKRKVIILSANNDWDKSSAKMSERLADAIGESLECRSREF